MGIDAGDTIFGNWGWSVFCVEFPVPATGRFLDCVVPIPVL